MRMKTNKLVPYLACQVFCHEILTIYLLNLLIEDYFPLKSIKGTYQRITKYADPKSALSKQIL